MKKIISKNKVVDVIDTLVDYVADGELHKNSLVKNVMVESESDLDELSSYGVGTIAYTAGLKDVWQKDADGEWQSMTEEEE